MKHTGDLVAAAALGDEARCMDLADRYLNSKCVKRMLQADQVLKLFSNSFSSSNCYQFFLAFFSLVFDV
uniref:Uncharacterized protein n=1 Tax=Rhizophora mucronata TaxID=61149 RepID=A0A2P2IK83_RHIMU